MRKIKLFTYPWQAPLFLFVTIYGIYQFGWIDWRVIVMYFVTAFFVWENIMRIKHWKKK
ncbi:MAG: hypothetical protein V2A62_01280 [Candidatus Woesearchaeota archaeon]